MAEHTITQFSPSALAAALARGEALRKSVPPQTGESVDAYLLRAGVTDPKERLTLLRALRVAAYVKQHALGGRLADCVALKLIGESEAESRVEVVWAAQSTRAR